MWRQGDRTLAAYIFRLMLSCCPARPSCCLIQGVIGACDSVCLKPVVTTVVMTFSDVGLNYIINEKYCKLKRSLYTMHIFQCSTEEVHSK